MAGVRQYTADTLVSTQTFRHDQMRLPAGKQLFPQDCKEETECLVMTSTSFTLCMQAHKAPSRTQPPPHLTNAHMLNPTHMHTILHSCLYTHMCSHAGGWPPPPHTHGHNWAPNPPLLPAILGTPTHACKPTNIHYLKSPHPQHQHQHTHTPASGHSSITAFALLPWLGSFRS